MKKFLMRAGAVAVASSPMLVLAQAVGNPQPGYIVSLINSISSILNLLLPLVFAAAVLGFLIGLGMYFLGAGDEGSKEKAKEIMKMGLIVLFVMFAVYGIIKLFSNILGIGLGGSITPPSLPTQGSAGAQP
ncbi:MAG TPA: hypothetical protein VD967_01010 [Candidatus Paceibacterota bacterium]|nr:hypothetical protein [Candidatus Paceibacterota bacterium]